jgi:hypothetical protein
MKLGVGARKRVKKKQKEHGDQSRFSRTACHQNMHADENVTVHLPLSLKLLHLCPPTSYRAGNLGLLPMVDPVIHAGRESFIFSLLSGLLLSLSGGGILFLFGGGVFSSGLGLGRGPEGLNDVSVNILQAWFRDHLTRLSLRSCMIRVESL